VVVGDKWDAEADRRRGDPSVGGVGALRERVTARFAVCAELGVDVDELGACVNDLG
jgi:hypothetical protein